MKYPHHEWTSWSTHLLIPITLSYALGITLYRNASFPAGLSFLFVAVICSLSLVLWLKRFQRLSCLFLILAFLFFGMVYGDRVMQPVLDSHHIAHRVDEQLDAIIVGTLASKVSHSTDVSKATIDVAHIRTQPNDPLSSVEGRVLLTLKGSWPEEIRPGDVLMVRTTLQPPPVINTPGTFNYRRYLASRGIFLTGWVNHPILISRVSSEDSSQVDNFERSFRNHIMYRVESLRTDISTFIDATLPIHIGSLYKALIIGDRSEIPPETLEVFKQTGTFHLLAVSGMHTGFIIALFYCIINWVLRRWELLMLHCNVRKAALILTLPIIVFYALLTGANPPVIRSLLMLTVFIGAFCINRLQSPLTTLSGAAFLVLLFDPAALFSASFQLSFAAAGAIILFVPRLTALADSSVAVIHSGPLPGAIIKLFITIGIVTIVATIGTLPLMLEHFNRISLVTLPANLLIQPLICLWSLPAGILSILCSFISIDLASLVLQAGSLGIEATIAVGTFLSGFGKTQLWLPGPSFTSCLLYYSSLLILAVRVPHRFMMVCSLPLFTLAIFMIFNPTWNIPFRAEDRGAISVLDVGHGSATVIEMTNGHTVLVDGGAKSAPGYNSGTRIIAPFLWHRQIAHIDDIIITHDDADHYNGISTVIERFHPDRLFIPDVDTPKKGLQKIIDCAQDDGVTVITPGADLVIEQDDEAIIIVLADKNSSGRKPSPDVWSEDDRGLLVKFESDYFSMLFPGDITAAKEAELVNRLQNMASTVLLSPHHGSSTSNSYLFLHAVNPEYLLFSANDRGSGLFPSSIALTNAAALQINTLTTSQNGSILINFTSGSPYQVTTFNRSKQHFFRNS